MTEQSVEHRLIEAALTHFGRAGLDGASTRAIARDADTLMSSITYHFGGKQALYLAVADHIADRMQGWMAPALAHADRLCDETGDIAAARAAVHAIIAGMSTVMLRDETAEISRFIVREQAEPTEAFARLYKGVMQRMLDRLSGLLRRIAGERLGEDGARVRAMTLIGQVLVFRVARATVMTGMGWAAIGPDEADLVRAAVAANLDAILDQLQSGAFA